MNNIFNDINKYNEKIEKLENENENLKIQIKQLKEFAEEEVRQKSRLIKWIESLRNENEKLNECIKILSC
tara:strand:- start:2663 stop:2872 length:210 start_codon:yes stop_codon:yes gene_type:complete